MMSRKKVSSSFKNLDRSSIDPTSRKFFYDAADELYDKDLHSLETTTNNAKKEQVMGLGNLSSDDNTCSSSDEDNDELDSNDDDSQTNETSDDDDLFQIKGEGSSLKSKEEDVLMGKKKSDYFGTDISDTIIHRKNKKKQYKKGNDMSDLIQEESWKLREKMASKVKISSIANLIDKKQPKSPETLTSMSSSSSLKIKSKEDYKYPEKELVLRDYKELKQDLEERLEPLWEIAQKGLLPPGPSTEYYKTRYYLTMNYLVVICSYNFLANSEHYHPKHPVISRLTQFRYLLKEMNKFDAKFSPKLAKILKDYKNGKLIAEPTKQKMLSIINKRSKMSSSSDEEASGSEIEDQPMEEERTGPRVALTDSEEEEEQKQDDTMEMENDGEEESKSRPISHKIAKNKGLMPTRKKEQRNPRVKYRNKYQNKLKRRKGQVRTVKKELNRYSGEATGIKMNVVKSIKLK